MILNKSFLTFIFIFILVMHSFSQGIQVDSTNLVKLEQVFVTATRTNRFISTLPLPVHIISKRDIEQANSVRLNDILNEQTGLITVSDYGGGEGIQMQGLDSQYTLILVDGMPLVGRLAGTLDIMRLTTANIKKIEVVKGASSSLYGSDAMGGVINIITENPEKGFNVKLNYRLETFSTEDMSAVLNYKKAKFGLRAFLNKYSSNGFDLNPKTELKTVDPFVNYTFNLKTEYSFSKQSNFYLSLKYFNQNQDYNASAILRGESSIKEWSSNLKFTREFSAKLRAYFEFYATVFKTDNYLINSENGTFFDSNYFDQQLIRPELRVQYKFNEVNELIGGIGYSHESLDRTNFSVQPKFNAPYVYLQYDSNLTNDINMIIGARFDSHNKYRSQFSPKAAVRYSLNKKWSLKGSVGYGFKAPDFRQLFFDFTNSTVGYTVLGFNVANSALAQLQSQGEIANLIISPSDLKNTLSPENSISTNIGVDYKLSPKLNFKVNFFRNNINDLIDTRVIANKTNGQNVFSYYNVNKVYTSGFEIDGKWKPFNQLKITGGYQLLFAKDKEAEAAFEKGDVYARKDPVSPAFQLKKEDYFGLFNRSRHMVNLKLFYMLPKWKAFANVRLTYRSKYGLLDSNGNNYLDVYDDFVEAYSILDFSINKTFFKNYSLNIGIDNLFNFTDPQNISNIPGRIIYAKLNISL